MRHKVMVHSGITAASAHRVEVNAAHSIAINLSHNLPRHLDGSTPRHDLLMLLDSALKGGWHHQYVHHVSTAFSWCECLHLNMGGAQPDVS
jgi:hypothetical protein